MATVLVVDDDRVLSHLVASLLRGKGHKVLNAFDAVQGLMLAMRSPLPDAIVLDINMPGGSGEETLRKLKMSRDSICTMRGRTCGCRCSSRQAARPRRPLFSPRNGSLSD